MTQHQESWHDLYHITQVPFCLVNVSGQELRAFPKEFGRMYRLDFCRALIAALEQSPSPGGVLEFYVDNVRFMAVARVSPSAYLITAPVAASAWAASEPFRADYVRAARRAEFEDLLQNVPLKRNFALACLAFLGKCLCGGGDIDREIYIRHYASGDVMPLRRHRDAERQAISGYRKSTAESIRYIYQHLYQRIGIQELSEHVHLNRSTLSAYFKADTGMTITAFISEAKLREAANLLTDPNVDYPQILDLLGFCNQSYFIKKFRERFGMTPQQYRKRIL